jgi:hypothetical protein
MQENEILKSELTQNRNNIVDLENKIRNLEVDVLFKERIIIGKKIFYGKN